MEQEARGWYSRPGFVCRDCVSDQALAGAIQAEVTETGCNFCGATSSAPIAADMDILLRAVADGFHSEYEDPVHHVAYNSGEGGYLMPLTSTIDLAIDHEVSENSKVLDQIVQSFQHDWVPRNPYHPSPVEVLAWGWSDFREHVMHRRRFTFLLPTADGSAARSDGRIPPEDMLAALSSAISDANLVKRVLAGTEY
jgi:hypothetical protein